MAFDLLADSKLEKRVVAVAFLPDTPSAYKDPRSSLGEGRDSFVIVPSEVSTNLDSSDYDYEYDHEQEPKTHLRIMIRQFVS
jgi:hypothetical protein